MKVAIVIPHYHDEGGSERRTAELVRYLLRGGHDVHLFANRWKPSLVDETCGAARVHRVPIVKGHPALKTLSFALLARRATRNGGFDIVHSQARTLGDDVVTAGGGSHRAWWEGWQRDAESAWERFQLRWSLFHRVTMWIEQKQYAQCRALIVNSRWSGNQFVKYGQIEANKIHVVHNGVDSEKFHPRHRSRWRSVVRQELSMAEDEIVILHLGSGFARKGVKELIAAFAELCASNPNERLRLLIVGKGNVAPYRQLAQTLRVSEKVTFAGGSPSPEKFYAAADVFALLTKFDPFANATLEAMACGLPVVTTTTNGVSEILTPGVNGVVVSDPHAAAAVASALQRLLDVEQREVMGRNARELMAQFFTWEQTAQRTVEVYRQVRASCASSRSTWTNSATSSSRFQP
jgi:UDP-glucose:(heptosyl)LPS alpha-1,3-glucosyltransferase